MLPPPPPPELKKAREDICAKCQHFAGQCLELRKRKGCSAASAPWQSAYLTCPLGKWPLRQQKHNPNTPLDPKALAIIKKQTTGHTLELGTGTGRGTLAALQNATHVTTIEHSYPFFHLAARQFADHPRVTTRQRHLTDNTYTDLQDLGTFDTIIIDGPPGTAARAATLAITPNMLNPAGKIIIDDAKRDYDHIQHAAAQHNLKLRLFNTPKGLAILTND